MKFFLAVAASFALTACTKPNPAVCCVSAEDCSSIGVSDTSRDCSAGLACQDHSCVEPTCTTSADCSGNTPVCTNGTCVACDAQNACPMSELCKTDDGTCVACLTSTDCAAADPVCDAASNTCRSCKLDSECSSGACADDGTCVPEDNIVYLDPAGTGAAGTCTRATPCNTLSLAIATANTLRNHIVLATGNYTDTAATINISSVRTSAQTVVVHGAQSTLTAAAGGEPIIFIDDVATTIQDVTFTGGSVNVQTGTGSVTIARSTFENAQGVLAGSGLLTLVNVKIVAKAGRFGIGMNSTSHVKLEGGVLQGGVSAISDNNDGGNIDVTNMMVFGTTGTALDIANTTGAIRFSTIVGAPTAIAGLKCNLNFVVQSSIIWDLQSSAVPVTGACPISTSIVGPVPIAGSMSADPKFVDATNNDFHIAAGSPAIDLVPAGPTVDFEGDPRPQGPRFDVGADEAK